VIGIGIMSFDRPHYLGPMLQSLGANDLTDCEVWLFQDGRECHVTGRQMARQEDIAECVGLFEQADLPLGRVVAHTHNLGIGLNRLALYNALMRNYDSFIQLEDDVVLAPGFVALMHKLLSDFADNEDVGLIRSSLRPCDDIEKTYCILRDATWWAAFGAFGTRSEWFASVLAQYERYCDVIRPYPYTPHEDYAGLVTKLIGPDTVPSSDGALIWATDTTRRYPWTIPMPRARSIGAHGVHCRPEIFERLRMHEVILRDYPNELAIEWQKVYA